MDDLGQEIAFREIDLDIGLFILFLSILHKAL